MTETFQELADAGNEGIGPYMSAYLKNARSVFDIACSPALLKSYIHAKSVDRPDDALRFSLVFNDLTLFSPVEERELRMAWLQPEWLKKAVGGKQPTLEISEYAAQTLGLKPDSDIAPAFVFPGGKAVDVLLRDLSPLIEAKRLLVQPQRTVFARSEELTERGGNVWNSCPVEQFTPLNNWRMTEERSAPAIPIAPSIGGDASEMSLFEITVPYLTSVSFRDFAAILLDESDLLSPLRSSLLTAIKEASTKVQAREFAKDVIDPKIDLLNRRFKSVLNTNSFRVGGAAISTVVLSYTAAATGGLAAAITTVAGAGGLGLMANAYSDFRKEVNELKNDPFYFLWRCKFNK